MTAPFTHTPRPPYVPAEKSDAFDFRYCADDGRVLKVVWGNDGEMITVSRYQEDCCAAVEISLSNVTMRLNLGVDNLRELARCLIDAAADIEGEAA
jgi:hypothetical protein